MGDFIKYHRKGILAGTAALLSIVLVISVALQYFIPATVSQETKEVTAKISSDYEADKIYTPDENAVFRTDAKFRILEVVPYRGMAEIGYGIAGEEPVDISKIKKGDWTSHLEQVVHVNSGILKWEGSDSTGKLVNQNKFIKTTLKAALKLSDKQVESYIENSYVDVLVVEPETLNAHPELIEDSDYVYIHNNFYEGNNTAFERLVYLYEKYSYETKSGTLPKKYSNAPDTCSMKEYPKYYGEGDPKTDFTMDVVKKLFYYGCIDKYALAFSGYTIKNEADNCSNLQKLGYAIAATEYLYTTKNRNMDEMYDAIFSKPHDESWTNFWNVKSLVSYLCADQSYDHTEIDDMAAKADNMFSNAVDNEFIGHYKDTTVVVLAHGGGDEASIISKLGSGDNYGYITPIDGEDYCADVGNNSRDVSVQILNANRPTFYVLDIEPDNKFTLTAANVRKWMPGMKIRVEVLAMTMSQFVGKVNDLNSDYDMIYFGKNINKMLGGKFYYTGVAGASAELAGYQGENVTGSDFMYSGNDITDRMVNKVKAFYEAGYPIAYETDLADENKANIDTKIYQYLKDNEDTFYKAVDGAITEGGATAGCIDEDDILTGKPLIFHTLGSGVKEYTEGTANEIDKNGFNKLEFNLNLADGNYRAFFYIDYDHNGIFNMWDTSSGDYKQDPNYDTSLWQTDFTNFDVVKLTEMANKITIPVDAMLGVVSYKLEVVKLKDGKLTGIRTNITGNVKCSGSQKTIKVLQLSDLTAYSDMDLSASSDEAKAFQKLAKSSVVSSSFDIKVTTHDLFNVDLSDLNMLNYDVIIIGFIDPNTKLLDPDGLLNKVAIAATKGKGIIFTQDALSYFNNVADAAHWGTNMNYRVRTLLGMDSFGVYSSGSSTAPASKMAFTYSILNKFSENEYFSGLQSEITDTDIVTRINEAKIARYPYIMDVNASGFDTNSGIYQVDVEQNSLTTQRGVSYFCLSDFDEDKNYSVSPNDAKNNYYLWRYDTVFYTGLTVDSFQCGGGTLLNTNEIKLFVNTIISAYGLERSITINVTNLHRLSDNKFGKTYSLYADVDYTETSLSGTKNVEFNLTKKGLKSSEIQLSFYFADRDGNKISGPLDLYQEVRTFKTSGTGGTKTTFQVEAGKDYTFVYPYEFLNGGSNENILIEATVVEDGKTITDCVLIKAIRRSMFDLD